MYLKKIWTEFKNFAIKGNAIDLAVGVVIGASFNGIVNSIVNDVINPVVSLLTGHVNLSGLYIALSTTHYASTSTAAAAGVPIISYGNVISNLINFFIVAFVIFLMVKKINKLKRQPAPPPANTKCCPFCQTDIPKKATRCPNCTSTLSPEEKPAPQA